MPAIHRQYTLHSVISHLRDEYYLVTDYTRTDDLTHNNREVNFLNR